MKISEKIFRKMQFSPCHMKFNGVYVRALKLYCWVFCCLFFSDSHSKKVAGILEFGQLGFGLEMAKT